MKTFLFLFVVCVCCAVGATGQVRGASISAQPQVVSMPYHPEFAPQAGMAVEHNITGHSASYSAHGERPLWEMMPERIATPLGDSARAARQEHAAAKKAVIVWSNY
jgi:hypothetical protein